MWGPEAKRTFSARRLFLTLGAVLSLGAPLQALPAAANPYDSFHHYSVDGTTPLDNATHVTDLGTTIRNYWIGAMMNMAQQMATTMMMQMAAVGAMYDGKIMLETQQQIQLLVAEAHRDYQPDLTMCTIGGNVRSLAASDQKARINARAFDLTMLKRNMLSTDMGPTIGNGPDIEQRYATFRKTYCDSADINGGMVDICDKTVPPARINKDINYTDTVESHYTLNADFTNQTASDEKTADQNDVIALSRNLFAFTPFSPISPDLIEQDYAKDQYQDMRSVDAMRDVATNSFAHIVGMRMAGADNTDTVRPYMGAVMKQLGVTGDDNPDIDLLLGKNPSYYAQMEVLTHKIYEDPRFFTNLYTTPANVERIGATLQALRLIQDRDRFESSLRREMMASVMLELSIRDHQAGTLGQLTCNAAMGTTC